MKILDFNFLQLGRLVQEGTDVKITIKRDDKIIELPYALELKKRKYSHRLRILKDLTDSQQNYYSVWIGNNK
jgi:hypothetical protein|tara:strand:+ start:67 stop:282 length:216 start_codon:yes stop_codon:yes gene_type:complete